jgi:hypothetical protein
MSRQCILESFYSTLHIRLKFVGGQSPVKFVNHWDEGTALVIILGVMILADTDEIKLGIVLLILTV